MGWSVVGSNEGLMAGVSARREPRHNRKEMGFGPVWIQANGRNDENRLWVQTLPIISFLLNTFYIALARAILLVFQVSDILSEGMGLAIANLKLLVNVGAW